MVDVFQKSLQFGLTFQTGIESYEEKEREREAELSQTQRGCQKPQLFSWQPHLSSEFHRVEKYYKYKYNSERESRDS